MSFCFKVEVRHHRCYWMAPMSWMSQESAASVIGHWVIAVDDFAKGGLCHLARIAVVDDFGSLVLVN